MKPFSDYIRGLDEAKLRKLRRMVSEELKRKQRQEIIEQMNRTSDGNNTN